MLCCSWPELLWVDFGELLLIYILLLTLYMSCERQTSSSLLARLGSGSNWSRRIFRLDSIRWEFTLHHWICQYSMIIWYTSQYAYTGNAVFSFYGRIRLGSSDFYSGGGGFPEKRDDIVISGHFLNFQRFSLDLLTNNVIAKGFK